MIFLKVVLITALKIFQTYVTFPFWFVRVKFFFIFYRINFDQLNFSVVRDSLSYGGGGDVAMMGLGDLLGRGGGGLSLGFEF